jgi:hypothetical protein
LPNIENRVEDEPAADGAVLLHEETELPVFRAVRAPDQILGADADIASGEPRSLQVHA